jgi:glutamate dehydrogenase (NAD(P)+)
VVCDPFQLSNAELERITRRYTSAIIETLGPDSDVPAPDVNTNERVMAWIMDTYSMHKRHTVTAVVTGKPVEMGGSLGRREATGRGCMLVTREALKRLRMPVGGTRVAIQGFGNVGSVAAQLMENLGLMVVAVSDKSGGIYHPKGLKIRDVLQHSRQKRSLGDYKEAERITNEDLLTLDCEVLVPAAMENVITSHNARDIKARIICEGANGPTTAGADKILEENGVFVIPDILANAGGVTVSYFEWVQDRGGYFWDEDTVNQRLERIMVESFDEVAGMAGRNGINLRIGAYMLAIERVAAVHRLRGMYA